MQEIIVTLRVSASVKFLRIASPNAPVITSLAINQGRAPLGINYPSPCNWTVQHAEWQKLPSATRRMPTPIKCSHDADLSSVTPVTTRVTNTHIRTDLTKIIKIKKKFYRRNYNETDFEKLCLFIFFACKLRNSGYVKDDWQENTHSGYLREFNFLYKLNLLWRFL